MSDCSGPCWLCTCAGGCLAGNGDDDFQQATDEQLVKRLIEGEYPDYSLDLRRYLCSRGIHGVAYFEDGHEEYIRDYGFLTDDTIRFETNSGVYFYGLRIDYPEILYHDNNPRIDILCRHEFYTIEYSRGDLSFPGYREYLRERVSVPIVQIKTWEGVNE